MQTQLHFAPFASFADQKKAGIVGRYGKDLDDLISNFWVQIADYRMNTWRPPCLMNYGHWFWKDMEGYQAIWQSLYVAYLGRRSVVWPQTLEIGLVSS